MNSSFAENLKKIRLEKQMSQEEFARLLKTSKQNISRYESGAVSPKISTAAKFADLLGCSLSDLNGEDPSAFARSFDPSSSQAFSCAPSGDAPILSQDEIRLLSIYRSLNAEGQEKAHAYLSDLAIIYHSEKNQSVPVSDSLI